MFHLFSSYHIQTNGWALDGLIVSFVIELEI